MQIGRQKHIYFYHLNKCGGASVGGWLEQHVADRRIIDRRRIALYSRLWGEPELANVDERLAEAEARQVFWSADAFGSHPPLLRFAPPGTFAFTLLRSPSARIVSQVADWRRFGPHDAARLHDATARMVLDAASKPLAAFLETHGGHYAFDNWITRALAGVTLGPRARNVANPAAILDEAIANLESRFDLVGLTEHMPESLGALADALGFAPVGAPPHLNRTGSDTQMTAEVAAAEALLAEATRCDEVLYAHAAKLFEARHRAAGARYNRMAFEARHAAQTLAELDGEMVGDDIIFSVRHPVVATGLHPRDGAGLEACCIWSGPGARFTVYMPAPAGARLAVKLYIRGYASTLQRERLTAFIDGAKAEPRYEPAEGYAEVATFEARATRPFLALDIDVGVATTAGADPRLKGLAFDRYGWRVLAE
jgi:hypothetical protein